MYKAYGTCKTVASRMARKRMRQEVFTYNKKTNKTKRKAARLERKQKEIE